jgi:UDP-N-acetylglucosamine diphosphorylase / glucose-1-phosphate thymidylyltransferase / UDP-N-acetylgalactosamine diphosphorylase / glucosamine-1-phosphate N-acetyltransferase / galactosamine-1-phosphate N-acetyltransferase
MKMNIVMPMAGLGSRFKEAGYSIPKPLIPVLGKPMYAWATDSLPLECANQLIFILLESQPEYQTLKDDILRRYAIYNPVVLSVRTLTRGQSETVLTAKSLIDNNTPLLIHNADTAFEIGKDWLADLVKYQPEGALLVFESSENRWSFSREDEAGRVVEVREKKPISCWASTGTYYFASGSAFVKLAESRILGHQAESGEFYVAPLYNDVIADGGLVKNYVIERLFCFGTPLDLEESLLLLNKKD